MAGKHLDPESLARIPASRRTIIKGLGAAGLAGGLILPGFRSARAEDTITLRWWSPQSAPDQLAAYQAQIAAFEKANPGIKVVFEPTSDEGYPAQFAAAFASKQLPDVVTHLPSFAAQTYYAQGLLEPFDDVIQAIGPEKFFPKVNDIFKAPDGHYVGTALGTGADDMLWIRTDLMAKAGIDKIPETWDELRTACQKMQTGGVYGAPLPYGLNSMTSLIIIGFIHRAGGQIFTPDLQVGIDTPEAQKALEFYKSMREFCPPSATNYSWGESLTAFVSGATATGIYAGRVLANVNAQNPEIADFITCRTYPTISKDVPPWVFNDAPSVFIPKGIAHVAEAKKFAAFLFEPEGYIRQLHGAPGHVLPALKTIADSPEYQANPIIKKYPKEVALMSEAGAGGFNLGFESPAHKSNAKANDIIGSNILAEMVQRICLNNEDSKTVLGETAGKLDALMES